MNSIMVAIDPLKKNKSEFQKTLYFNDFYLRGTDDHPYPLGHVQLIGKLQAEMIKGQRPHIPKWALSLPRTVVPIGGCSRRICPTLKIVSR